MSGRYLRTLAGALAVLLAGAAGFCALVDPYGMLGTPAIPGLTERKPTAVDRPRLAKPYRVEHMRPATLVVGSSTASVGFAPDSPAWRPEHRPVYNLGLDGAPARLQQLLLMHALVRARPRLVVVSTGFEDSLTPRGGPLSAAEQEFYRIDPRLRVQADGSPNPDYPATRLKDTLSAVLSVRALRDSVATLLSRDGPWADDLTASGHDRAGRLARWTASSGSRAMVEDKDRFNVLRLLRWRQEASGWQLEPVGAMIRAARAAGADVAVLIAPSYVDQAEIRRQLGLSASVQEWRAQLVRIVEDAADATGGRAHVSLWDFGAVSPWTAEPLPAPGDTDNPLRWFYETVHFRPALGSLIIDRLASGGGPAGFGERLSAATLAESAARHDAAARDWAERNPQEVTRIAAIVRDAARRLCGADPAACLPQSAGK